MSYHPALAPLRKLVAISKLSRRIARDREEMKGKLGLGHFEGRNWRRFHYHATLSGAGYGFLILKRSLFPALGNLRLR